MKYTPTKFMASDSHYDKTAADYAVGFIESLTLPKAHGQENRSICFHGRNSLSGTCSAF